MKDILNVHLIRGNSRRLHITRNCSSSYTSAQMINGNHRIIASHFAFARNHHYYLAIALTRAGEPGMMNVDPNTLTFALAGKTINGAPKYTEIHSPLQSARR